MTTAVEAATSVPNPMVTTTYGPSTTDLCNELNRATRSVMKCQCDPKGRLARIESNICQIMAKMLVSLTTFENILRRCVLPRFTSNTLLARESTNLLKSLTTLGDYVTYAMWDELHCLRPKLVALSLSKYEESNIHAVARFAEALRLEAIAQQEGVDDNDDDDDDQMYESRDASVMTEEDVSLRLNRPIETFTMQADGTVLQTVG